MAEALSTTTISGLALCRRRLASASGRSSPTYSSHAGITTVVCPDVTGAALPGCADAAPRVPPSPPSLRGIAKEPQGPVRIADQKHSPTAGGWRPPMAHEGRWGQELVAHDAR